MSNAVCERAVRMIKNASSGAMVALDLETTGLDPRRDEIRPVQVSDGEKIFVIDLFHRDGRALFEALSRDDLKVLVHGGAFEYGFVYQKYGIAFDNMVDTLLLSRLAARGDMSVGASLGDVAKRELDVELDKEMQGADWALDPLPKRQLDYAAMDVKVLPPIYERLW